MSEESKGITVTSFERLLDNTKRGRFKRGTSATVTVVDEKLTVCTRIGEERDLVWVYDVAPGVEDLDAVVSVAGLKKAVRKVAEGTQSHFVPRVTTKHLVLGEDGKAPKTSITEVTKPARVPVVESRARFEDASLLVDAFTRTRYAVCDDDARYGLNGFRLEADPYVVDRAWVVATDGHRLAAISFPVEHPDEFFSYPTKEMLSRDVDFDLVSQLVSGAGTFAFDVEGGRLVVNSEVGGFTVRKIAGEFPDWCQVVPNTDGPRLVTYTEGMLAAAKWVDDKKATGNDRIVALERDAENLLVHRTKTNRRGWTKGAKAYVKAAFDRDWPNLGVDPSFLAEGVENAAHGSKTVHIVLADNSKSAVLRPVRLQTPDRVVEEVHILMPMRLD